MHRLVALVLASLAAAPSAWAQGASPYLPIADWTTPYVEHLIRSGVIVDPNPLTRPLRRVEVLDALRKADTTQIPEATRATIREMIAWLGPRDEGGVIYRAEGDLGPTAATQRRRDVLRPSGNAYASYHGDARLSGTFGPIAASVHPYADSYLCLDPDFTGTLTCQPPGRFTDSYISVQGRYGELFFGAMDRNWGVPGLDGFLTSAHPYSYDHVYAWVGTPEIKIEVLTTQLDDFTDTSGQPDHRYWMTSRVRFQPWPWLLASFDNATLWYGVDRNFELPFLNPLKLSFFQARDDNLGDQQNSLVAGDLRILLPHHMVLQGSILVDAIRSGPLGGTHQDPFPDRLGWMGAFETPLFTGASGRFWWEVVTAYAYRSPAGLDNSIMLRGVGLGKNFADYFETGASVSFIPAPMVTLAPEIVYLKQGQGDFRLPTPAGFVTGPTLFDGIAETTLRLGVRGHARLAAHIDLDGDAGLHLTQNTGHVTGVSGSTFVGRLAVCYQLFNRAYLGH